MDLLRWIARERQAAVITITYDERWTEGFDSVYRMEDGRLRKDRSAAEVDALAVGI